MQSKCRKINTESQQDAGSLRELTMARQCIKERECVLYMGWSRCSCMPNERSRNNLFEICYKEVDLYREILKIIASHQCKILFCSVLFLIIPQAGKTNLGDHIFLPSGTLSFRVYFWSLVLVFILRTTLASHFINRIIIINNNQTVQFLNLPLSLLDIQFMHGTCWVSITLLSYG